MSVKIVDYLDGGTVRDRRAALVSVDGGAVSEAVIQREDYGFPRVGLTYTCALTRSERGDVQLWGFRYYGSVCGQDIHAGQYVPYDDFCPGQIVRGRVVTVYGTKKLDGRSYALTKTYIEGYRSVPATFDTAFLENGKIPYPVARLADLAAGGPPDAISAERLKDICDRMPKMPIEAGAPFRAVVDFPEFARIPRGDERIEVLNLRIIGNWGPLPWITPREQGALAAWPESRALVETAKMFRSIGEVLGRGRRRSQTELVETPELRFQTHMKWPRPSPSI